MKQSGFAYSLASLLFALGLTVAGVLAWIFWKDYLLPPRDLTADYNEVNGAVKDFLSEIGVNDSHIVQQYGREIRKGGFIWVESFKKIDIPAGYQPKKLPSEFKKKIKKVSGGFAREFYTDGHLGMEAGRHGRVFYKIVFVSSAAKEAKKKAAVIIDDLGYRTDLLERFLGLGITLTYAILPGETHTKKIADMLDSLGREYILHLPLEPEGYPEVNPGKQALLCSMSSEEILKKAEKIFGYLPGVKGFNFHMGSRFSSDYEKMDILLGFAEERGLFVVDSRTALKSAVQKASADKNVKVLYNDIFLDTQKEVDNIAARLDDCLNIALKKGSCVAIGHIHSANLPEALKSASEKFKRNGVSFVSLSELIH